MSNESSQTVNAIVQNFLTYPNSKASDRVIGNIQIGSD